MLFEYKAPGELETLARRKHHAQQAIGYLEDADIGADVVILTDGKTWGILRDSPNPEPGEQGWLDFGIEVSTPPDERFQWRPNSPDTARRVLDLLATIRSVPVSVESLVAHLGPRRAEIRNLLTALALALTSRSPNSRPDILFRQWLALAGVSYGIETAKTPWPQERSNILGELSDALPELDYPETIFLLHSYVAYSSKLIAAETLSLIRGQNDNRPSQWISLSKSEFYLQIENLESGLLAENLRAPRLMGGDLFGWYAPLLSRRPDLERAIRESLKSFAELAWARLAHVTTVTGDLLRDFYSEVVPRQLRKALGEFFTPQWIAEKVVQTAISLADNGSDRALRILDPSCGSGTFLVTAFQRALLSAASRGLNRTDQALEAIDSIYGIDINPVSSIMSRVNLLLTLGDRVEELGQISFNIYQADSILIPEEHFGEMRLDQVGDLRVPLVIGDVMLPTALSTLQRITALSRVIDQSLRAKRSRSTFGLRFASELRSMAASDSDIMEAVEPAEALYMRLKKLHEEETDGIWAHVIEQSFAPRVMPSMDVVVGNPPWISWKHLPPAWRERSQPVWEQWGLWQTKAASGVPMSDISSLLLARSIATYCPTGVVAMLLPEGILVNEPGGRAIRRCRLVNFVPNSEKNLVTFRPVHVDDFTCLNPFSPGAANKPIALYVRSGQLPSFPIQSSVWERAVSRASLRSHDSWAKVSKQLTESVVKLAPIDAEDVSSRWRPVGNLGAALDLRPLNRPASYTWGQGFHSRGADGIFYCEVISKRPMVGRVVRVRTRPDLGRNTKGLQSVEIDVEADFVWPMLRGQNIDRFLPRASGMYCLLPHDPDDLTKILTVSQLIARAPRLYDYLEQHVDRLVNRSAYDMKLTLERPWGIQGTAWKHLTSRSFLVVSRYMQPEKLPPAAVVVPHEYVELGRSTTIYPNNKVNFVSCASEREADFVAAFVNSSPAQALIRRQCSSTTIAPGAMNRIPVPKFSEADLLHGELADLGARCREDPAIWLNVEPEVDQLVERVGAGL